MAFLTNFKISVDKNGNPFLTLKDKSGATFRAEMTHDALYKIAQGLPRQANALAQRKTFGSKPSHNLVANADLVEASELFVTEDVHKQSIALVVNDASGIRCGWRMTPELAAATGEKLSARAKKVKNDMPPVN